MEDEGMSKGYWVKLSVGYFDDDRILTVGAEAELLFVRGLAWAKRDGSGLVSHGGLVRLGLGLVDVSEAIRRLCDVGLWVQTDFGYSIAAWSEWQTDSEALAARANGGRKGAHLRWHKTPHVGCEWCSDGSPMGQPISNPMPKTELELDNKTLDRRVATKPAFDEFWQVYPRRVAKGAASKAWSKATKRATTDRILDGARRMADRWVRLTPDERQFVPHPATWLNSDRWDDELEPPPGVTVRSSPGWVADSSCVMCGGDGFATMLDARGTTVFAPCACRTSGD